MKLKIKFVGFILTIVFIFSSCKKETENTSTSLSPKTVKARVIEYGSDLPIAGAKLTICTTAVRTQSGLECAGNYSSYITDANGECFFRTDSIYKFPDFDAVLKDGYVDLREPGHNCLYETNIRYLPDGSSAFNQADSFIIRKVPYRYVTVHVKNANADLDTDLYLHVMAIINPRNTINNCSTGLFMMPVKLRQWIDTTFQCLAYGNMDNEYIIAGMNWESGGITILGKVYQQIEYIPQNGNITVEILY